MARPQENTYVIYSRAGPNFFVTIRNGRVVLAPADPYEDRWQLWCKIAQNTDDNGLECFTLINRATNQAVKHPLPHQPVELIVADPSTQDESLLWSEANASDGYKVIQMTNNSTQNWDAQSSTIRDGVQVICNDRNGGNHQQWIIAEWAPLPDTVMGPPVRVVCKAVPDQQSTEQSTEQSISIRDGRVVFAPLNPYDKFQQWFKHEKSESTFVLIHKATGQAIKHSKENHPLALINYRSDIDTIIWTEEKVGSTGYKYIRLANQTSLSWDAQQVGGGTVFSYVWHGGDNQQWIIAPCAPLAPKELVFKVYCKEWPDYSITIRDGKVVLAPFNLYDESQAWYKYEKPKDFYHNIILVNKATGEAIKHPTATTRDSFAELKLTTYIPNVDDESILWTEWNLLDGYKTIGMANDTSDKTWDAAASDYSVGCHPWHGGNNQRWIIATY